MEAPRAYVCKLILGICQAHATFVRNVSMSLASTEAAISSSEVLSIAMIT